MRPLRVTDTKRHKQPEQKGNCLRHKAGFRARLLLASFCVAVISATAPVAGPARGQNSDAAAIDPARIAAAKELMEVAGSAKQFDIVVPLISQQLEAAFINLKPDHAAEIKEVFQVIPEKFSQRKQELLDQIAALYAERLTAAELNEIIGFYKSPIGAKFVQLQPELVQQSMALGQAWGRKIGEEIDQEVRKELKQRGVSI